MDLQQALRMIEWLDEERRRDKNTIARLEEQIKNQQEFMGQLNKQINGLESQQVSMQSKFMPAERDTELMEQFRAEMRQMLEDVESKRAVSDRETERRTEYAREMMSRPLRDVSDRLDKIEREFDTIAATRAERDRISSSLVAVQQRVEDIAKKLDEPERRISFLEEQRRQDNRRLADMQGEFPELQKSIDGIKLKIERVEALALSNEKRVLEVQGGERTRREELQTFIDQQNLIAQQRDQQVKELTRNMGAYDEDIRRNMERFENWAETHRQMKKLVDDFTRISERLDRRINEVAEMQRLSEDRFRDEWQEWGKEDQRRWKQFTLTNDEAWRNYEQEMSSRRTELEDIRELFMPLKQSLDKVWKMEEERARLYLEGYQDMLIRFNVPIPKPPLMPTTLPSDNNDHDE